MDMVLAAPSLLLAMALIAGRLAGGRAMMWRPRPRIWFEGKMKRRVANISTPRHEDTSTDAGKGDARKRRSKDVVAAGRAWSGDL
ncbi:hypothetical protein IWZ01DRAFT_503277 [Phyllosticta capitalensis]